MRPKGEVNLATWLLLVAVLGALYAGAMFGPAYLDNLTVREAVDVGLSSGSRSADEAIATRIINYVNLGPNRVGTHFEEDPESGGQVEVPGLGLTLDNVTIERFEQQQLIRITVDYQRRVRLKPTQSHRTLHFRVQKEGPALP